MADFDEIAKKIERAYKVLDESDYYRILSVPRDADLETIRKAYYARARILHPDKVRNFPEPVKSQAIQIFKRVAEGYRILSDPKLRKAYDEGLAEGKKRLVVMDRLTLKPKTEFDSLTTEAGKNYYKSAKEYFESGKLSQAKLSLKLAIQYEGENPLLTQLLAKIEEKSKT
jgi:curved DNA-binding protein CbpA